MLIQKNTQTNGPVAQATPARTGGYRWNGRHLLVAALVMLGWSRAAHAQPQMYVFYDTVLNQIQHLDTVVLDDTEVGEEVLFLFQVDSIGDPELVIFEMDPTALSNNVTIDSLGFSDVFGSFPAGLSFTTTAPGLAEVSVFIHSNDATRASFFFKVQTTVIATPEILVTYVDADGDTKIMKNNDEIDLGTFEADEQSAFLFQILNQGDDLLEVTEVRAQSNSPSIENLQAGATEIVALNEFAASVNFLTAQAGLFEIDVEIDSNDPTNPTFRFTLTGEVEEEEVQIIDCNFNGIDDALELDTDADGYIDDCDNCPLDYNPDQLDTDANGVGEACELIEQQYEDCDTDGMDDALELDSDQDGYIDDCDNCPEHYNPEQTDQDEDGYGDACDDEEEDELVCPEEYEPVCGVDGNTYGNDCYATKAGVNVAFSGECQQQEEEKKEEERREQDDERNLGRGEGMGGGGGGGAMCGAGLMPLLMMGLCCVALGHSKSRRGFAQEVLV